MKPFRLILKTYKILNWPASPVYDGRYIKAKMRTYLEKVYNYFCGLNMPKDNVESESFIFVTDNL